MSGYDNKRGSRQRCTSSTTSEPLGATYRALSHQQRENQSSSLKSLSRPPGTSLFRVERLLNPACAAQEKEREKESRLFDPFCTICTQCREKRAYREEGRKRVFSKTDSHSSVRRMMMLFYVTNATSVGKREYRSSARDSRENPRSIKCAPSI